MAEDTLKTKIEHVFPSLSKSQQRVAKLILDSPTLVLMHSAAELGKHAETSETTVIRFCYALGLSGYTELQSTITSTVVQTSSLGTYIASKESYTDEEQYASVIMGAISQQITDIASRIDAQLFDEATKKLHTTKRVVIIGEGASYIAAQWLRFTLSILRPNVQVATKDTTSLIKLYREINEDCLIVLISLHRYYKEAIQVTEQLKSLGAEVLAITDSSVAPAIRLADYPFVLQSPNHSTIDLLPALMAFLNTLVAGMTKQDLPYYEEQQKIYEKLHVNYLQNRWS